MVSNLLYVQPKNSNSLYSYVYSIKLGSRGKMTFPEFGIDKFRDFPKSGSYRLAVAGHPGLSHRGKTENKIDAQMKI